MTNYIKRFYDKEIWKHVVLKEPFSERYEIEVSNYGKVRKRTIGTEVEKIMSFGKTEGYPSVTLSIITKLSETETKMFQEMRNVYLNLKKENKENLINLAKIEPTESNYQILLNSIEETNKLIEKEKNKYKIKYHKSEIKRRKGWGNLVHRLVAIAFVEKPSIQHNLVAHLDYDKENNHHSNLKWMTKQEIGIHNKKSPYVIKYRAELKLKPPVITSKLTESEVMLIKKRINEGVSLREIAKRAKVTETQLLRIKRGINWGKTPAAL